MEPTTNLDVPGRKSAFVRLNSALLYGLCSFTMVFLNKFVLSMLEFPSFIVFAVSQMLFVVVCLFIASRCSVITLPTLDSTIPKKIFPLPLLFFIGLVGGLGGTQRINLPMFTALRHTSIFITMVLECAILGTIPSNGVKLSVLLILSGSMLAASCDLAFDLSGYLLIFVNNIAGSLNGVVLKQKLDAKDLDPYSLLFYNSLFMVPFGVYLAYYVGDFSKVINYLQNTNGNLLLVLSSMLLAFSCGLMLNYSMLKCTEYNSALTTTFVGATKNTAVTYIGMIVSGDYIFQLFNFIGISMTVVGSLLYVFVTFGSKHTQECQQKTMYTKQNPKQSKPISESEYSRAPIYSPPSSTLYWQDSFGWSSSRPSDTFPRVQKRTRNTSGTSMSIEEHSPTTPLNTQPSNQNLFFADSSSSVDSPLPQQAF